MEKQTDSPFIRLSKINVNDKTEKKGNGKTSFTYLSWSFAVEELMKADPNANWVIHEPKYYGQQVMVSCTVTAFDKPIYMWLPVMNHINSAIDNPSVTDINKAQMRCLVKAIACHGLGLYIYAGEDLPSDDGQETQQNVQNVQQMQYISQAQANELKAILGNLSDVGRRHAMAEMQKCGVASIEQMQPQYFNDWKGFLLNLS